jgi:hypothetical protein
MELRNSGNWDANRNPQSEINVELRTQEIGMPIRKNPKSAICNCRSRAHSAFRTPHLHSSSICQLQPVRIGNVRRGIGPSALAVPDIPVEPPSWRYRMSIRPGCLRVAVAAGTAPGARRGAGHLEPPVELQALAGARGITGAAGDQTAVLLRSA